MTFLWQQTIVYYLTKKANKSDSLIQKTCMFLQEETSHCRNSSVWVNGNPSTIFLAESFNQWYWLKWWSFRTGWEAWLTTSWLKWVGFTNKMAESLNSFYSSIFTLENLWFIILPEVDQIHNKLWVLFQL